MALRFTRAAEDDLLHIFIDGIRAFGEHHAARYQSRLKRSLEFIEANPRGVRERTELTPIVRVHPSGVHVIIYKIEENGDVLVIRVREAREDWINDQTDAQ